MADTKFEYSGESTKQFVEYMGMRYPPNSDDLLDRLVAELYLYDRGDGTLVCAGPIYCFTFND